MSDTTNKIRFRCVNCDRKMAVRSDWGGKRVKCPDCGAANVVPVADAAPDLYEVDDQQGAAGRTSPAPALPPVSAGETRPTQTNSESARQKARPVRSNTKVILGAVVGIFVGGGSFFLLVGDVAINEIRLRTSSVETTATIVNMRRGERGSEKKYNLSYTYIVDGATYARTAAITLSAGDNLRGKRTVEIIYYPGAPDVSRPKSGRTSEDIVALIFATVLGLFFMVGIPVGIWWGQKRLVRQR